jgi:hypothetical protein
VQQQTSIAEQQQEDQGIVRAQLPGLQCGSAGLKEEPGQASVNISVDVQLLHCAVAEC